MTEFHEKFCPKNHSLYMDEININDFNVTFIDILYLVEFPSVLK